MRAAPRVTNPGWVARRRGVVRRAGSLAAQRQADKHRSRRGTRATRLPKRRISNGWRLEAMQPPCKYYPISEETWCGSNRFLKLRWRYRAPDGTDAHLRTADTATPPARCGRFLRRDAYCFLKPPGMDAEPAGLAISAAGSSGCKFLLAGGQGIRSAQTR
jgi:hypothetical protein